ncbi:MAG: hypothetical protein LBH59_01475 [Planctomycetaceae bacterium]|nr:hypothetical protein [Planctomycetaceae bacterium]
MTTSAKKILGIPSCNFSIITYYIQTCDYEFQKRTIILINYIPKPVWAVGFALEQTLRDATLAVFSFANFKTASA